MNNTTAFALAIPTLQLLVDAAQARTLRPNGNSVAELFSDATLQLFDAECFVRAAKTQLASDLERIKLRKQERVVFEQVTGAALADLAAFAATMRLPEPVQVTAQPLQLQPPKSSIAQQKQSQSLVQTETDSGKKELQQPQPEEQQEEQEDQESTTSIPAPVPTAPEKKMKMAISLLSDAEFDALPKYLLNRLTLDKINTSLADFNKLLTAKYASLKIPHAKMTKVQRDRYWEHKKSSNDATKGKAFLMEREIKENWWAGSATGKDKSAVSCFKLDPLGRNVLALIRHLGRIKEVRGGGDTRIVIL